MCDPFVLIVKQIEIKKIKLSVYTYIYRSVSVFTFAAVIAGISQVTSLVTLPSLFVTWIVVQTVTTTFVDTVISIGTVNTLCNNYRSR